MPYAKFIKQNKSIFKQIIQEKDMIGDILDFDKNGKFLETIVKNIKLVDLIIKDEDLIEQILSNKDRFMNKIKKLFPSYSSDDLKPVSTNSNIKSANLSGSLTFLEKLSHLKKSEDLED